MDKETFDIIDRIAKEHSGPKKIFGYLTEEDLKNEIWLICLEQIKEFKDDRGKLEHFLRVSVKNRMINRFKDITKVVRSPCPRCPFFDLKSPSNCSEFGDDRHLCKKWTNYQLSKESRNSLLNVSDTSIERLFSENRLDKIVNEEIRDYITLNLSVVLKKDLDLLMNNYRIPKKRLEKLKTEIARLLEEKDKEDDTVKITIKGKNQNKES